MSRRQELCRDFQRGNCRFGARCKYLHQLPGQQQQQQQQQRFQQQTKEFGGGGNYYNVLGNNNNNSNQRQSQNHASKDHRCNDPRICKEQIKDDFVNERPTFWRLTSYAHYKFLPNDIVGDVSPEELRALAYEGAKQGLSLKDVAQREASMVAAKVAEFDALLRNPYKGPARNSSGLQSSSFASSPFLSPPQKSGSFMPFVQSANVSTTVPREVFAQVPFTGTPTNSFNFGQPSGDVQFGKQAANVWAGSPNPFGQQAAVSQQSPFRGIASQAPVTQSPFLNLQGSSIALNTNGVQSPFFPTPGTATQANSPFTQHSPSFPSSGSTAGFYTPGTHPGLDTAGPVSKMSTTPTQVAPPKAEKDAIWLKDFWKIGEIPEGEPPEEVRF